MLYDTIVAIAVAGAAIAALYTLVQLALETRR